jgi:hypothetical protein
MSLLDRETKLGDAQDLERVFEQSTPPVLQAELLLLAAASLGAGLIHAGFAPGHFEETWSHGAFFVLAAWLQLTFAVTIIAFPSRRVYWLGVLNICVIAAWAVSRTIGAPFGPNAGVAEGVGVSDLIATGLEALIVVCALGLLWRSRGGRGVRVLRGSRWMLSSAIAGCIIVAAASTAALTPRFAGEHHHGTVDASGVAADGHNHGTVAGAPGVTLTGNTPCEKSGPPASEGSITDESGHSHRGPTEQVSIDEATSALLSTQQTQARALAAHFPTVAAAEAGGYRRSTAFVPCIGAHYTNVALAVSFNPATPSELLFDGTTPDAHMVGLSYLVYHPGGAPDGFAGPNDGWHQHTFNGGLCMNIAGIVIGAESTSPEQCRALGGFKIPLTDVWMLHDWVVPGFECSWGIFAPECPELGGRTGGTAWDPPDPKGTPIPAG